MDRIRVASLQYLIRPVETFEQFEEQVSGLVDTAKDYDVHLVVFPEYFTLQLLTLNDVRRPIAEQVRHLAEERPRFVEMMAGMAQRSGMHIVGGSIPSIGPTGRLNNESYIFSPSGEYRVQGKLHMTRFEVEDFKIEPSAQFKVFETPFGRLAIAICYDVEFPEMARAAARLGAHILVVPSCTDDRQGMLRVRYCAQARAIENQMYVVVSHTVGSLPMVPAVSLNYGSAAIFTPSDFAFSRDGILAEGIANQETMVIGELNLSTIGDTRKSGTVIPLLDSERTAQLLETVGVESL
jgi:predicted amidohydrolase